MKTRPGNPIEEDVVSRWCRRFFPCFGRPGYAKYGKNLIARRSRREGKREIKDQLEDYQFGIDPD